MEAVQWYGVQTVYEHEARATDGTRLYEERIVLVRARSQDEAIIQAEGEAEAFARSLPGTRSLGYAMAYGPFDAVGENVEVFSLMRESVLGFEPYLDAFFDTGQERTV